MRPFGFVPRARSALPRRRIFPRDEFYPEEQHPELASRMPSVPDGETAGDRYLKGYMRKQHGSLAACSNERNPWATRFVFVDDSKGRLYYARRQDMMNDPTLGLPLQDVTGVRALPRVGATEHCIEVECAPHRLVLQAYDGEHQAKVVRSIEQRVSRWRRKAEIDGVLTATPIFGVAEGAHPHQCWKLKQAVHVW